MDLPTYQQLIQGAAGSVPLRRALWRLAGPDRVRYLNGQVTNDVSRLQAGKALYAAVTSAKGRMMGDVFIGAAEDALYVDSPLELRDSLSARLEKYLIADDAAWEDLTDTWSLTHVFGAGRPELPPTKVAASIESETAAHAPLTPFGTAARDSVVDTITDTTPSGHPPRIASDIVDDRTVAAAREAEAAARAAAESEALAAMQAEPEQEGSEDGYGAPAVANVPTAIANPRFGLAGWDVWLPPGTVEASAAAPVPADVVETIRIEHGLAAWGVDMDESNLPPESLIEQRSISYTKGCYLGQEIIARLKSVGQVNKRLCVLQCMEPEADPETLKGAALSVDERDVGRITSATLSPAANGRVVCLGYVHRAVGPDATLKSSAGHTFSIISPLLTALKN